MVLVRLSCGHLWLSLGVLLGCVVSPAAAQSSRHTQPFTGYELALRGGQEVRVGRENRFHGVAYRVRGLAELVPFPGPVRVRFSRVAEGMADDDPAPWVSAATSPDGRFVVDVPVPLQTGARAWPHLVVAVGPPDAAREFSIYVTEGSAVAVMLQMDRVLYEAGETAHVWALLTDAMTQRPMGGERLRFTIGDSPDGPLPSRSDEVVTTVAGVAHLEVPIPANTRAGSMRVKVDVPGQMETSASFRIGTRTLARLVATVSLGPDPVPPSGMARAEVQVSTPSGTPVAGAEVTGYLEGTETRHRGRTGPDGRFAFSVRAPAYLVHETGSVGVRVEVRHPAHGSASAVGQLNLAVPLALDIEAFPAHGGLVPEVDEPLYVRLQDAVGNPPPAGTEVRVEGPVIPRGTATAFTDLNGLAVVTARAPVGVASAGTNDQALTSVVVTVVGPVERVARVSVPVLRDAAISLSLDRVVAEPGDVVTVGLVRRPGAGRRAAIVELNDPKGRPLSVQRVSGGVSRVRITLPPEHLGLLSVWVRPVDEDESSTSIGVVERLIVRPASPDFVSVEPERRRWVVGETARVRIHTRPEGPRSFAAVLVRDLSAHGGERRFRRHFLGGAFDRAILEPTTETAELLGRATLASDPLLDQAPFVAPPLVDALGLPKEPMGNGTASIRGDLRDPYSLSRELSRRGVADAMRALEEAFTRALESDTVDTLTTGRGASRRFRRDFFTPDPAPGPRGSGHGAFVTLGGQPMTPAILEAADPSFGFDAVARRAGRVRLVRLWVALAHYLDPGDEASPAQRRAVREPSERWLARMVEAGLLSQHELDDPWGGRFQLRRTPSPVFVVSARATHLELVSPGPDGRPGTADDLRDPFARVVRRGTPYAVASGEDDLMRRLAVLSPLEATLRTIQESYQRVTVEMSEEEIGDAVFGNVSEARYGVSGLGLLGTTGQGGGFGRGTSGSGMRGRTMRVPQVRVGAAMVNGLARVLRERFPPTLLFVPSIELDASGTTEVPIALADTVTTYLVEAIVWREDGWVWSAETRIEVDRDVVIAAPIPETAHQGDRLQLPLRVSNRGSTARSITVRLLGDRGLGVADSEGHSLRLPANGSAQVPIDVFLSQVGEGTLTVVATSSTGEALDAVRRPIHVLPVARRVHVTTDVLGDGRGGVSLEVPEGATAQGGAIRVVAGDALFAPLDAASAWAYWAPPRGPNDRPDWYGADPGAPVVLLQGMRLSALYRNEGVADEEVSEAAEELTLLVDGDPRIGQDGGTIERRRALALAALLLGLAPMARDLDRRPGTPEVELLVERTRARLTERALGTSEDPALWVLGAAALGWAASDDGPGAGSAVGELVRRLERHVIAVGEDRWLVAEGARRPRSTLLLAMACLSLGRRQEALDYLATVGRWSVLGLGGAPAGRPGHTLSEYERALARTLLHRLVRGPRPGAVTLWVDGAVRRVPLVDGAASIDAAELARPGRHRVSVGVPTGAPVWLETSVHYGVSWRRVPERTGPVAVSIDGEVGLVDELTALAVVVRNRTPRVLPRTIVEVALPTGAEVVASDLQALRRGGVSAHQEDDVLRLVLPPLSPGRERRLPLSLRFTIEGVLRGLGVSAWAADRPAQVSVLRPRRMHLRREAP